MLDLARIRQAYSFKSNLRSLWDRPGERYAPIDGLRALSMLWVVLTHVCLVVSHFVPYDAYVRMMDRNAWLFSWVLHGEMALDSFFVISGFLIGVMLLAEHRKTGDIKLGRFFARRYLRLMPAYAVALVILVAAGTEGKEKQAYVWANILYVNNFLTQKHMFMDPSWSLAVEEQFYVCLPFFLLGAFFRAKRKLLSLVLLFAASVAITAVVLTLHPAVTQVPYGDHFIVCAAGHTSEYFDALYVNLYTRFAPFVLGLGLAWAVVSHEDRLREAFAGRPHLPDTLLVLGVALLLCVLAVPAFNAHVTIAHALLWLYILVQRDVWSAGILLVMVGVLYPRSALARGFARFLAARIWFPIAQLSYCAYLFHLGVAVPALLLAMAIAQPGVPFADAVLALRAPDLLLGYAFTMVLSFLIGAFMYLGVERPFLNMRPR